MRKILKRERTKLIETSPSLVPKSNLATRLNEDSERWSAYLLPLGKTVFVFDSDGLGGGGVAAGGLSDLGAGATWGAGDFLASRISWATRESGPTGSITKTCLVLIRMKSGLCHSLPRLIRRLAVFFLSRSTTVLT